MNDEYNSQYSGLELDNSIKYLKDSWLQVQISGGIEGKTVQLLSGKNRTGVNLLPKTISWTTSNCTYETYSYKSNIQYDNYDVIIAQANNDDAKLSYNLEVDPTHIYYFKGFVDGINSHNSIHGIRFENISDSTTVLAYLTTSLGARVVSMRGSFPETSIRLALHLNLTNATPTETRNVRSAPATRATGYCSVCGETCSYTVGYEQWTDSIHAIRHWCSNCGYDQSGGAMSESHTYSSRGTCTKCGYYNSSYDYTTYEDDDDYQSDYGSSSGGWNWSSGSSSSGSSSSSSSNGVNVISYDNIVEVHYGRLALIDLTDCFGEGNEPTQVWCDNHIDFYNSYDKYQSTVLIRDLDAKYEPVTGIFDENGIALVNLPGFDTWTVGTTQLNVNEVKRYFLEISEAENNFSPIPEDEDGWHNYYATYGSLGKTSSKVYIFENINGEAIPITQPITELLPEYTSLHFKIYRSKDVESKYENYKNDTTVRDVAMVYQGDNEYKATYSTLSSGSYKMFAVLYPES